MSPKSIPQLFVGLCKSFWQCIQYPLPLILALKCFEPAALRQCRSSHQQHTLQLLQPVKENVRTIFATGSRFTQIGVTNQLAKKFLLTCFDSFLRLVTISWPPVSTSMIFSANLQTNCFTATLEVSLSKLLLHNFRWINQGLPRGCNRTARTRWH